MYRILLAVALAGPLLASTSASGTQISLVTPPISFVQSVVSIGRESDGQSLQVTALPFSGTASASFGSGTSDSAATLTNRIFSVLLEQAHPGQDLSLTARSFMWIRFSLDADLAYEVSGSYAALDPEGRRIEFEVELRNSTTGEALFLSEHASLGAPNESFTAGQPGGNLVSNVSGSATGTLFAGDVHDFIVSARLAGPALEAAAASGSASLVLSPEPSSALLLAAGLLALAARRRYA